MEPIFMNQMTYFDGGLIMDYIKDNNVPHYRINGERFRHNNELLKIIKRNDGICLESKHYGTFTHCDFDCFNCNKSAYHLLRLKEKFFNQRCEMACSRIPKAGDEWEMSMVMEEGFPYRYLDFHFTATQDLSDVGKSIIELCSEALDHINGDIYNKTHFCYIKIKRFDDDKALDVSITANKYIKDKFHV